jgi:restriction endonuclease S subunit
MLSNNQKVKLSDVCTLKGGTGFPVLYQGKSTGDFAFIKVSDMNTPGNERFVIKSNNWLDAHDLPIVKPKIIPAKSTVFAKVGAALLLNRRRLLSFDMAIDNNMMAAIPNKKIEHDYLFYLMQTVDMGKLVQEGALPSINQKQVGEIKISLPPLEEQRKIAACLSTWDKVINAHDRLIALKEKQKSGVVQSLFSEIEHTRSFSNILDIVIGGTPSRSNNQYWDKDRQTENRWISIANMKSSVISDSTEYISDHGVKNSNVKLLEAGTVIFSFKLSLGKKAILGKPCYTNEAIAGLVIKDDGSLDRDYLYHALSVVDTDKEIDQAVKGKTLNKAKLNRLELPWCSISNQVKISRILNCADNEIKVLIKKRDLLKKQKQGLMQQLLS